MQHAQQQRRAQAGFTTLEALFATLIGLIAMGAFTVFTITQMYGMRNQTQQVDVQTAARSIADLFVREVRLAGSNTNPNCLGLVSVAVLQANSTTFQYQANIDKTPGMLAANESVIYKIDSANNQITRTDVNSSITPVTLWSGQSVSGSQLSYYDGSGNKLAEPVDLLQIRRVKLDLSLASTMTTSGKQQSQSAKASADVELRNRFFTAAGCAYN